MEAALHYAEYHTTTTVVSLYSARRRPPTDRCCQEPVEYNTDMIGAVKISRIWETTRIRLLLVIKQHYPYRYGVRTFHE